MKETANGDLSPLSTMYASENEGLKDGSKTQGNRIMAGKEFNFLHKLEIK